MDLLLVFEKVSLALGLGLLVGLQRERVQSPLAGIRTFALITVLGTVCALVESHFGGWFVGMGIISLAALLVVGNLAQPGVKEADPGLTTEIAALLMYGIGVYLVVGHTAVAIALGGATSLLLHWKAPMHAFVARIGESDLKAIMRFVLITLVILPVLPDQSFGPYEVLNPRQVWLMVVLIVGISLVGYVGYKLFGQHAGAVLTGVLGGLISSTATTFSTARQAPSSGEGARLSALIILLASTVAVGRVIGEIAVVASGDFWSMAMPLGILLAVMALICGSVYLFAGGNDVEPPPPPGNPADLVPALVFGGFYAVVLLASATVNDSSGASGLYAVAILSGVHDLDAITLSTARLVDQGQLDPESGWRLILAACLSNLVVKGALAGILGGRRLFRWVIWPLLASLASGIGLLCFFSG